MMFQLGAHIILIYFCIYIPIGYNYCKCVFSFASILEVGFFFGHNKHHKNVATLQCFEIKLVFRLSCVHYFGCSHVEHVTKALRLMESNVWMGETGIAHGCPYQDWRHVSCGWQHISTKSTTLQSKFRHDNFFLSNKGLSYTSDNLSIIKNGYVS